MYMLFRKEKKYIIINIIIQLFVEGKTWRALFHTENEEWIANYSRKKRKDSRCVCNKNIKPIVFLFETQDFKILLVHVLTHEKVQHEVMLHGMWNEDIMPIAFICETGVRLAKCIVTIQTLVPLWLFHGRLTAR
jgi:hypothetical protein